MFYNRDNGETKQRFGIRKLTIGTCSVLLSTLFLTMGINQTVHADPIDSSDMSTEQVDKNQDSGEETENDSNNENKATESAGQSSGDSAAISDAQNAGDGQVEDKTSGSNGSEESGASGEDDTSSENLENTTATDDHANSANNQNSGDASADKDKTDIVSVADLATANPNTVGESKAAANNTNDTTTTTTTEGITHNADGTTTYTPVYDSSKGQYVAPTGIPTDLDLDLIKNVTVTFEVDAPNTDKTELGLQDSYIETKNLRRTATVAKDGTVTYGDWYLSGAVVDGQIQKDYKINDPDNYNYLVTNKIIPTNGDYEEEAVYTGTDEKASGLWQPDYNSSKGEARYREENVYVDDLRDVTVKIMWQNTQKYEFVDTDEDNKVVPVNGEDTFATVSGYITQNADQQVTLPTIPDNYELVEGQTLPGGTAVTSDLIGKATTVQVTGASIVQIKLKHKTVTYTNSVDSTTHVATPQADTPQNIIDGTSNINDPANGTDGMLKTVEVGIVVTGAPEVNGKDINQRYTFTKHFYRDATVDLVTGAVTYGEWNLDGALNSQGQVMPTQHYAETETTSYYFPFSDTDTLPTKIPGYTRSVSNFETTPAGYNWGNGTIKHEISPYGNQQAFKIFNTTVGSLPDKVIETITWTANNQTAKLEYVDTQDSNKVVQSYSLSGVTDQTIDIPTEDQTVPSGYKLEDGQQVPTTYKFTADSNQVITVPLVHKTITVEASDPKNSTDTLPSGTDVATTYPNGKNYPSGVAQNDLNKTVTQTITITKPGEQAQTTTHTTTLARNATVDLVNGNVTYSAVTTTGNQTWPAYEIPTVDGYTPQVTVDGKTTTESSIPAVTPTFDTTDQTVNITYQANQQTLTVQFVDDQATDDEDNVVSEQTYSGKPYVTGATVSLTLTVPDKYQLAEGQTLPKEYTLKASDNVITIHLVHKQVDSYEYATRTATVNYVYGTDYDGHKKGDQASKSATIDFYYKRSVKRDAVTNEIISGTEGNWNWDSTYDDNGFTHGYKVENGSWTVPTSFAPVVNTVPTIDGYTAWTTISSTSVPTNEFVYPTYTGGDGVNKDTENSVAYTSTNNSGQANLYEATPVHTVWYLPTAEQNQTRTITENFVKTDENGNLTSELAADPIQAEVYYTRDITSYNPDTGEVTYGNWTWDTSKGDSNTPGIHVISGSWQTPSTTDSSATWGINLPTVDGYTAAHLAVDGSFDTAVLNNPSTDADSIFTNSDNTTAVESRNNITTYYVPNSALEKTITRTVDLYDEDRILLKKGYATQHAEFYRTARVNTGDNGITFGGINSSNHWAAGAWNTNEYANWPAVSGLTKLVAGSVPTIDGKVVTAVPSQSVTSDMTDTTVDVIFVKKAVNVTISHPTITITYGQETPAIPDDIVHEVIATNSALTLPDGINATDLLNSSDFDFVNATNGQKVTPTSAGDYHIVLNSNGLQKLGKILQGYTINYDPSKSYVEYDIEKAKPNVTVDDAATKTYDGTAIQNYAPTVTIMIDGDNHVDTLHLSKGDYEFQLANGEWTTEAPVNVGTYNVRLTDQAAKDIASDSSEWAKNIDWTNFTTSDIKTTGQYVITTAQASAVLSGQNGKVYDGQAVTTAEVDSNYTDDHGIKVTISIPNTTTTVTYELQNGDYAWNTLDGTAPSHQGSYTITLNPQAIVTHLQDAINNTAWKGNVSIPEANISGSAGYVITAHDASADFSGSENSDYNGKEVSLTGQTISNTSEGFKITSGDLNIEYTFKDGDYYFTQNGETVTPINAGTYTVHLTPQGIKNIEDKYGTDYDWTNGISGVGSYTINKVNVTAEFSGDDTVTYTGKPVGTLVGNSNYKFTFGNVPASPAQQLSYTLQAGDYHITNEASQDVASPTNAGTYKIVLTNIGIHNLQDLSKNYNLPESAITQDATLTIKPQPATATISGNYTRPYDGTAVTSIPNDITLSINTGNTTPGLSYNLTSGDYQYEKVNADGTTTVVEAPLNVGTYKLVLTDQGINNIKNQTDDGNYSWADNSITTDATVTITPVVAKAEFEGSDSSTYTGSPIGSLAGNTHYTIEISGNPTGAPAMSYTLQDGDYYFTDAAGDKVENPTSAGTYTVHLTDVGVKHIEEQGDGNYVWTEDGNSTITGTGTYTIDPAKPTAEVQGEYTTTYNGSGVLSNGLTGTNIALNINTNGATPPFSYTLQDGDYEFVPVNGGSAITNPVNAGTYKLVLTDQGKENIAKQTDGGNYSWSNNQMTSSATVVVGKADATATLQGDAEKTYDSTSIANYKPTIKITAPGNPTYELQSGDYEFVPETNPNAAITTAPANAGTYTVRLTQQGINNIKKINAANLNWGSIDGTGQYVINKANATITLPADSTQTAAWTGSTPTIDPSKFVPTITTTNSNASSIALPSGVNLTTSDYEIVDDNDTVIKPTDIGTYKVRLTEAGWKKIANAVTGNSNYNWDYTGEGTLNIDKATATVSLSGTGKATYTGGAIVLDDNNLGTITVTLSNGETYTVKPEDLQFVNGAPVNAGTYNSSVELSDKGLQNISALDPTHYNYTYDNSKANFIVDKATATYQLSGEQSKIYNAQPGSLTADGHYQVNITTNNNQQLTFTLTNDDITFDTIGNAAPTAHGVYKVKLTDAALQKLTNSDNNYNWVAKGNVPSVATYDIKQAEMTVNVTGAESTVYNGNPQPLTDAQLADLKLTWSGSSIAPDGINSITLTAGDIEYLEKDANGDYQVMSGAPEHAIQEGESPYGIRLTQAGLKKIQDANKDGNYTFILGKDVQATYMIDPIHAQVTLRGYQSAPYTKNGVLDPSNFRVYLTNTSEVGDINVSDNQYGNHKLVDGDLVIEGYENGSLPTEVGSYKVKITKQLVDALRKIFPDYDFDAHKIEDPNGFFVKSDNSDAPGSAVKNSGNNDVAASNNDGKYIITPIDASIKLSGHQTIKYGESDTLKIDPTGQNGYNVQLVDTYGNEISGFTLTSADLEFTDKDDNVVIPREVGDYEVTLTPAAMEKINALGKNILGNNNYTWIDQFTPATFTVEQMPVTITVGDKSADSHPTITYGESATLNPNDYTISVKTENGDTLSYTLQAGDLAFENGTPTTAGTFNVVLSPAGLENIENKFGTKNYIYSNGGNGLFTIKAANPTVTLAGNDTQIYNGQAIPNYTVTATVTGPNTEQTITLSGDDLEYVDSNNKVYTTAPVNVGEYRVQLTQDGKDKIIAVNSDNLNWKDYSWDNLGKPIYDITKATATVTLDGSQSVHYTGSAVEIDWNNFVPTVSTNNGVTVTIPTDELTANDYVITDKDGHTVTVPTTAGDYTIKLTGAGLKKLESNTNNYDWLNVGQGTLTIVPATPTVTIDARDSKVYDGTAIAGYAPKVTITAPGVSDNNQVTLTTGDFEFKLADGTWTTNAPVNAGDYDVQLTANGLKKIEAVNAANLDWSEVVPAIQGAYRIEKANAEIRLSDSQQQTAAYTGQLAVIDPAKFVPTITDISNNKTLSMGDLKLDASDYEFVDDDGNVIAAPTNDGTYKVRLTASGAEKVEKAVTGNTNYNWTNEGTGLYVINASAPVITITANTGNNGKVYDGQPAEIGNDNYTITIKNSAGDVITTLDGSALQFVNDNVPVDVGSYQVELSPDEITNLQSLYPNYNWNNASTVTGNYGITPFAVTITTSGRVQVYETNIYLPKDTYSLTTSTTNLPQGWTMPVGDFNFDGAAPTNVGTYSVNFVGGQVALQNLLGKNYTVTYVPAKNNFVVVSAKKTGKVEYVDSSDANNIVGSKEISGNVGENAQVNAEDDIPAGWKIVPGQNIPATVPVTDQGISPVIVKVEHNTIEVTPEDPKTPDDIIPGTDVHYPDNVGQDDLVHEPTRTINVTEPGKATATTTQHAKLIRSATVDMVTGKVISYGNWNLGTNEWTKFDIPTIPGYTADIKATPEGSTLDAVTPNGDTQNVTIDITYKANQQSVTIKFVDTQDGNKQVGDSITKLGKTDEKIPLDLTVPEGYKLAKGETLPESYTFTTDKDQVIEIKLTHATKVIQPTDENKPDSIKDSDWKETYTRTIKVTKPGETTQTTTQIAVYTRTVTIDEVTGKIVDHGEWQLTKNEWTKFDIPQVAGYTAQVSPANANLAAVEKPNTNETINITYTANSEQPPTPTPTPEPTPEQGTHTIIYVDGDGNKVGEQVISGTEGTNVPFNPEYPSSWKPADSETIPDSVMIDNGTTKIVVVSDEEPAPVHPEPEPEKPENPETPESPTNPDEKPTTNEKPATNGSDSSNVIISRPKPTDEKQGASQMTSTSHESGKSESQTNASQGTKQKSSEKTLPQTGEKDNSLLGMIGSLLAGLGIFGLASDRRKKKNKD